MDETIEKLKALRDEVRRGLDAGKPTDRVVGQLSDHDRKRRERLLADLEDRLRKLGAL